MLLLIILRTFRACYIHFDRRISYEVQVNINKCYFDQVLRQVYPVDASNVDDDLVQSIEYPARDPNAPEVFYRLGHHQNKEDRVCMMHIVAIVYRILLCNG